MHFPSLLCIILLIWPMVGRADPGSDFIEILPTGHINWSKNILTAKGVCPTAADAALAPRRQGIASETAYRTATHNLLQTVKDLRMDANHLVADIIHGNAQFSDRLVQMVDTAQVVQEKQSPDGAWEITVQIPLLGGFLQMMLPDGIKQVEPIKAVNGSRTGANLIPQSPLLEAIPKDEGIYTGLVVDARGIGAKPAIVPVIVDESGKEVYGPAFISREYAVQFGVCQYMRADQAVATNPRVAPKALTAKGLRMLGGRNCDIVISNSDAAKVRDASANLTFLKQCRVIIILD